MMHFVYLLIMLGGWTPDAGGAGKHATTENVVAAFSTAQSCKEARASLTTGLTPLADPSELHCYQVELHR